jgi:hypothetical protein
MEPFGIDIQYRILDIDTYQYTESDARCIVVEVEPLSFRTIQDTAFLICFETVLCLDICEDRKRRSAFLLRKTFCLLDSDTYHVPGFRVPIDGISVGGIAREVEEVLRRDVQHAGNAQ